MKTLKYFTCFVALFVTIISLNACSSDDSSRDLEDYIIGNWQSYKCVVYAQGEKYDVEVSKNGQYSHSYFEFTFEKNGKAIVGMWDVDDFGASSWVKKNVSYTLNNDIVELNNEGSLLTLMYEENKNELYFRYYQSSESYGYLYLRKQ